jgi:NAD(P)-dependent dehydrogenase (short-subunit alcohol dehydrogenase family)
MTTPNTSGALNAGGVAVITGGASGIGLAAAIRLSQRGLNIVLADVNEGQLNEAREAVAAAADRDDTEVVTARVDVSNVDDLESLKSLAFDRFGKINFLMNNAGVALPAGPWGDVDGWRALLEINLFGVINGVQIFTPPILAQGEPAMIVNTASKQGITCPPGNAAYNTSKAAVKALTEALAHSLRTAEDSQVSAHLLVPGFVYSGMVSAFLPEKPAGAWTCEETVDHMLARLENGDFYIICPDNETPWEMDQKRIAWAAGDMIENRPALSRWHPDYVEAFERHMAE